MKFFGNSIKNTPYSAPNFTEWFIVKDLDIRKMKYCDSHLKVVSATFLLVCFVCLNESTCKARKNAFYFTWKALLILEVINF